MFESIMAFARTGDPANDRVPAWPASRPGSERVLVIDGAPRMRENYDHALIAAVEDYMKAHHTRGLAPEGNIQH